MNFKTVLIQIFIFKSLTNRKISCCLYHQDDCEKSRFLNSNIFKFTLSQNEAAFSHLGWKYKQVTENLKTINLRVISALMLLNFIMPKFAWLTHRCTKAKKINTQKCRVGSEPRATLRWFD